MSASKKYTPPSDFELQTGGTAAGFDSDSLQDNEIWLLRIPDNVSTKKLDGLQIKHPKAAHRSVLAKTKIGSSSYELIASGSDVPADFKGMAEMSVLVPDTDNDGMLTLLPNSCSRFLSLVEKFNLPDSTDYATAISTRNRPARPQPENMKMQFIPFGFYSAEEYDDMRHSGKPQNILLSQDTLDSPPAPALKKRKTVDSESAPASTQDMDVDQQEQPKEKKKKTAKSKDK
ncbi:hypothetical protein EV175_004346, partial [Coemansia sp. RSA 1933]